MGVLSSFDYSVHVPDLKSAADKKAVLTPMPGSAFAEAENKETVDACVSSLGLDVGLKRLLLNAKLAQFKSETEESDLHTAFLETLAMQ